MYRLTIRGWCMETPWSLPGRDGMPTQESGMRDPTFGGELDSKSAGPGVTAGGGITGDAIGTTTG